MLDASKATKRGSLGTVDADVPNHPAHHEDRGLAEQLVARQAGPSPELGQTSRDRGLPPWQIEGKRRIECLAVFVDL